MMPKTEHFHVRYPVSADAVVCRSGCQSALNTAVLAHNPAITYLAVDGRSGSRMIRIAAGLHARIAPALAVQPHQQEAIDQLKAAYQSYPRAGAHRDTAHVRAGLRGCGTDPVAAYLVTSAAAITAAPG
jgi:hypothetical protein